ncbi:MAG: M1 family metallopeptidase [Niabella sp.]
MFKFFCKIIVLFLISLFCLNANAQLPDAHKTVFTHQDSLRGTYGPGRSWWNVIRYDIHVRPDIPNKFISGYVDITFKIVQTSKSPMQIDLQEPMEIEKAEYAGEEAPVDFKREGNVYWLQHTSGLAAGQTKTLRIYYKGHPRVAIRAPWDGGWIWTKDSLGRDWVTVACQGLGASVWYPCKDHQSDEPDNGASLTITVPDTLVAVGNGRLRSEIKNNDGTATFTWEVKNPINNYDIIPYIGKYVNFKDQLQAEKGKLDLSYWVLDYDLEKAQKQFEVVKPMIRCFESWMGPYPFYEDSYKLVEVPHLGMEHQSAVAYGNKFRMGYLGRDLSGTGWGLKWDFIIVHESGHEWFGNNITSKDIADMWVHESFTNYTETMFTECAYGKKAGSEYLIGIRKNIANDVPIVGPYGVNKEGSGDMYYKGSNMLHTIRQVIDNDILFKNILRGLNRDFYHQTVTGKQVEDYFSKRSGKDLGKIFDQYLRTTLVPELQYQREGNNIRYKWTQVVKGFSMPVKLANGRWIYPKERLKTLSVAEAGGAQLNVVPDFYITVKQK